MLLRIEGLTVRYGTTVALHGLDLSLESGELFVLLGASGSGKTTLLRAIAGFIQPDAGRIALDGTELAGLPPHRRPVNTMFQSYALFPHMSVAANISFGLRQQRRPRAEIAARVAEMLALVRLEGFAARRPHQLSGGQQQRVALARALAPNPRLLLLDEPLSALDRNLRMETRGELVRLQKRVGTSFILVTHDQQEALSMADRIGVMHEGRLLQVGTPEEVYERPASRFVAEFLGAANILPVEVRDGVLVLPRLGVTVRTAMPVPPVPALLALRPERVRIGNGAVNVVDGVVVERAYAGEALTHSVRLADGTEMRVTQALHDGLGAEQPEVGAKVTLSWQPEACILLQEKPLPRCAVRAGRGRAAKRIDAKARSAEGEGDRVGTEPGDRAGMEQGDPVGIEPGDQVGTEQGHRVSTEF
ncbi:MAG TPA: ABC transporter ATP-binding protein [Acetobacteraceae bacterium]|nr:ABC transporter ATP-binding protein [Acetobacteraceae bacterium]